MNVYVLEISWTQHVYPQFYNVYSDLEVAKTDASRLLEGDLGAVSDFKWLSDWKLGGIQAVRRFTRNNQSGELLITRQKIVEEVGV